MLLRLYYMAETIYNDKLEHIFSLSLSCLPVQWLGGERRPVYNASIPFLPWGFSTQVFFYILSPVKFSLKPFPFFIHFSFLISFYSLFVSLSLSFFSLFLPLSFSLISYSESSFVVKNDDLSKGSEKIISQREISSSLEKGLK